MFLTGAWGCGGAIEITPLFCAFACCSFQLSEDVDSAAGDLQEAAEAIAAEFNSLLGIWFAEQPTVVKADGQGLKDEVWPAFFFFSDECVALSRGCALHSFQLLVGLNETQVTQPRWASRRLRPSSLNQQPLFC